MNILTFDIEEWFHLLDNESTKTEAEWSNYESRIHKNMDTIYNIIENSNSKASFFVVGWIAEKYPEVVREINRRGYEIGTHTHLHQLVYEQDRNTFYKDVERSIKTIEDCIGSKVSMFRAPGFSITEENKWAFEVLHELGIEIDCSVFPASRSHGGFSSFGAPKPSIIKHNGVTIKELPINYTSILSKPVIFSGGGYFRLFPYPLIKKWTESSDYVMTYFHPRDFDAGQPVIQDLSKARKFKSYVGIKGAEKKLDKWLQDFEFIDIETADKQIDWGEVPIVNL
jgi:polysaccharide deacetylase family protein (PEP-CTERM system associated)